MSETWRSVLLPRVKLSKVVLLSFFFFPQVDTNLDIFGKREF